MTTMGDLTIEFIPLENLELDPDNPRLPAEIDGNSEKEVLRWMLGEGNGNLPELMSSIGQQGFFVGEPLLVTADTRPKRKGKYIVVEGNRRLASVKLLLQPELATSFTKTVNEIAEQAKNKDLLRALPALIYPNRANILKYLGYRHVTGVKAWTALAKAKYLQELFDTEALTEPNIDKRLTNIARSIGSRKNTVSKQLAGLKVYREIEKRGYFDIKGLDEGEVDFSLLSTALGYENIYRFIGLASSTDLEQSNLKIPELKKLTTWVFQKNSEGRTRIIESRNLRDLNAVIGSPEALAQFDDGGLPLAEARLFTGLPLEVYRESIGASRKHLNTAQQAIAQVNSGIEESDVKAVGSVINIGRAIETVVKAKREDQQ